MIQAIDWAHDKLNLLDQRHLPSREIWIGIETWQGARDAIKDMVVRGAPAIGITAAFGLALAAKNDADIQQAYRELADSRPTAVNLEWALNRLMALPKHDFSSFLAEAHEIAAEDRRLCRAIGEHGSKLIKAGSRVMTICNTGSLATGGEGTALAIIRHGYKNGLIEKVWSCETRPRQQGLRLTAWELMQDSIPFFSIADSVAGSLMKNKEVDLVVAGADRIAANGDSANKIGTYMLAVLANFHQIPFIIAAPSSTIDSMLPTGDLIPIEERDSRELTEIEGVSIAPEGCPVFNPGFDVTPGELISAIVTETGVWNKPYRF